jgi:hypothetical protein
MSCNARKDFSLPRYSLLAMKCSKIATGRGIQLIAVMYFTCNARKQDSVIPSTLSHLKLLETGKL